MSVCIWFAWIRLVEKTKVVLIPTFIGSTGSTCAKWNYTERSCSLRITAQKHARFLFFKPIINLKWVGNGVIQSRTARLKESFVFNLNFVQKWHLFWMTGVIYLDALFGFPNKPWLVVRFHSCKILEFGFYWWISTVARTSARAKFVCNSWNPNATIRLPHRRLHSKGRHVSLHAYSEWLSGKWINS